MYMQPLQELKLQKRRLQYVQGQNQQVKHVLLHQEEDFQALYHEKQCHMNEGHQRLLKLQQDKKQQDFPEIIQHALINETFHHLMQNSLLKIILFSFKKNERVVPYKDVTLLKELYVLLEDVLINFYQ